MPKKGEKCKNLDWRDAEAWKRGMVHGHEIIRNLTKEQRAEYGRKGGRATQERRKRKLLLQELGQVIGHKRVSAKKVKPILEELGLPTDKEFIEAFTADGVVMLAQYSKAMDGDTNAATFLRDTLGQKPKESVKIEAVNARTANLSAMSDEDLLAASAEYEKEFAEVDERMLLTDGGGIEATIAMEGGGGGR